MNFKFELNEEINHAVKRVSIELLDDSILLLQQVNNSFDYSIHETRKNFKKMRGLLRLIRFELGYDLYKKENILFRDTGRILSGIRDAAVMIETLDYILKNYKDEIEKNVYKQLRRNISLRAQKIRRRFKKNQDLIEAIITILAKQRDEIRKWPLRKKNFYQLVPGIKLVYERGQNTLAIARKYPSAENYHQWRKRVKYLLYQTKILENAWPEFMVILSNKLSDLSEILGREHDLSELRKLLLTEANLCTNKLEQSRLFNLIGQERLKLQSEAKVIAPFVYVDKSDSFADRIESYWEQSLKLSKTT